MGLIAAMSSYSARPNVTLAQSSRVEIFLETASGRQTVVQLTKEVHSPDEVKACHWLYTAYRTSHGTFRRMLASFTTQLRHHSFLETFGANSELKVTGPRVAVFWQSHA